MSDRFDQLFNLTMQCVVISEAEERTTTLPLQVNVNVKLIFTSLSYMYALREVWSE